MARLKLRSEHRKNDTKEGPSWWKFHRVWEFCILFLKILRCCWRNQWKNSNKRNPNIFPEMDRRKFAEYKRNELKSEVTGNIDIYSKISCNHVHFTFWRVLKCWNIGKTTWRCRVISFQIVHKLMAPGITKKEETLLNVFTTFNDMLSYISNWLSMRQRFSKKFDAISMNNENSFPSQK
jgi:hypothetical protein